MERFRKIEKDRGWDRISKKIEREVEEADVVSEEKKKTIEAEEEDGHWHIKKKETQQLRTMARFRWSRDSGVDPLLPPLWRLPLGSSLSFSLPCMKKKRNGRRVSWKGFPRWKEYFFLLLLFSSLDSVDQRWAVGFENWIQRSKCSLLTKWQAV